MKKITIFLFIFIVLNGLLIDAKTANPTTTSGIVQCAKFPCDWQDLSNTLINLIKTVVWFSFWLAVLLSTIGAFLTMFHGPRPDLYKRGIDLIQTAIFGYILLLLSGVIFDVILEFFAPKFALLQSFEQITYFNSLKNLIIERLKSWESAPLAFQKILTSIFPK